ncbi:GNAT family N-acetyltransferase [Georgenia yuyongxinii]|uniref:GNAT family N-acetyltransferase n=1 Tax=Georgenia yuyongxinii TaxID=2589797 RepID=A0A552WKS7_9MICO|nr:GNAT family N-acetyltransferase [Georgenia yuyongxinii]TRW43358.1 GNAT family N-acetyltransferase [Georgenia yuyongxinii]
MTDIPSARIRPATALDADAIARAHGHARRETYGDRIPEDVYVDREGRAAGEWEQVLADPGATTTWVAVRDQEVVGFASVEATGPREVRPLQLRLLYVLAAEQGRRTGTHLMELAVGDAPCFLWVAETNTRAQEFYRLHGFVVDGARQTEPGMGDIPEIRMVR